MNVTQEAFLAGLLPGNETWPSAADLELGGSIDDLLAVDEAAAMAWQAISEWILPSRSELVELTQALREYEVSSPDVFAQGLLLAYSAYYSHPSVLRTVEEVSGYPARPPQPLGHQIIMSDPDQEPSSLGAPPKWRDDGTERSREIRAEQAQDPDRVWTEEEIATWPM